MNVPITVKQLQERYDNMSAEEKAKVEQDLQREIQRLQDLLDVLAKEDKGIEWNGQAWIIVDTPGLNRRLQEAEANVQQGTKRRRGPRRPATSIVAKGGETVAIRSDLLNQSLIRALRSRDEYRTYPEQGIAEYSKPIGQKQEGRLIITIRPRENEGFSTVLAAISTLGDDCLDTHIALLAMAMEQNGTERIRLPIMLSPDDILAVCGKEKSHGSYTIARRLAVISHLKTLSQARIIATMPGSRKDTFYKAEGPLILLSGIVGEYQTITGETLWEKYSVILGEWITMIPELNQQTGIMLRQLLAYSAKNERYQKRLGIYLTFMFRNNAKRGCVFVCSMAKLLEGAGIKPERQVGRFKDAIEQALAALQRDGVIGKYARIVDASPNGQEKEAEVREHANGWWDAYSRTQWRFEAPESIKRHYQGLLKEGKMP